MIPTYNELPIINFDYTTPVSYWRKDAQVSTDRSEVSNRINRLKIYLNLFNGSMTDLVTLNRGEVAPVINYFQRAAMGMSRTLTSTEPLITIAGQDIFDNDIFAGKWADSLFDMLPTLIQDYETFGTAVIANNFDKLTRFYPYQRYPADTNSEVIVRQTMNGHDVIKFLPGGIIINERYTSDQATMPNTLGTLTSTEELTPENQDAWAVLYDELDIDPIQLLTIQRPPYSELHLWGQSLYQIMYPIVREISIRYTGISSSLNKHANPTLIFETSVDEDTIKQRMFEGVDTDDYVDQVANQYLLDQWEEEDVQIVPQGHMARYLEWDPKLDGAQDTIKQLQEDLFSLTERPAQAYGYRDDGAPSGAALRMRLAPYHNLIASTQDIFIDYIRRAIAVRAASQGVSSVDLLNIINDTEIEWVHPLDLVYASDMQVQTEGATETEDESEVGEDE